MPSHSHALINGTANVTVHTTDSAALSADSDDGANGLGTGTGMPEISVKTLPQGTKLPELKFLEQHHFQAETNHSTLETLS